MNPLTEELFQFLKSKGYSHPPYLYGKEFKGKVPYSGPFYDDNEIKAALDNLLFSKWSVAGESVFKFERLFAQQTGHKHSVMVNSGSSANLVALGALKKYYQWEDDNEIIVSVVGFPTTTSAIILNNLIPSFVDIELETLNFDLNLIESKINSKTRAIFLSPVLGNPPDMDRLKEIAEKHKILIILDGCDSLGSKWNGQSLSKYSTVATCSFFPSHHISTLQGGMVTSDNEKIVDIARQMSTWYRACYCQGSANLLQNGVCGKRFSNWIPSQPDLIIDHKYYYEGIGYNLLPLDLQGAIGCEQIKKLETIHTKRKQNKKIITEFLSVLSKVRGVKEDNRSDVSWFGTPVICEDQETKEKLVKHLESHGVQTRHYFAGNLLLHEGYSNYGDWKEYPNANEVLRRVFFLGCWPGYLEEHLEHINNSIKKFTNE